MQKRKETNMSEEIINNLNEENESVEVIGIRFKDGGKVYYFDPYGCKGTLQDFAVVETARGIEFGKVCQANKLVSKNDIVPPLRPVIRIATEKDIKTNEENKRKEAEAIKVCQQKVASHGLEMKLIESEYTFDCSKLTFYFTADGRIDFRDLVKDLASTFKTRIELRQIGIRDEAKFMGGLGICGRPFCCSTFLPDFVQVSIKMAKEQSLSLNSSKISGACGRLMCCLRFEHESYVQEIKLTPPVGSSVRTNDGVGEVVEISPLTGYIKVNISDSIRTYHRDDVKVVARGKEKPADNDEE
jgi:cell fate regulator YaaT (PSP1 superfamily)